MSSADVLSSVGFEKNKMGAGDKELGYQIKQSSMTRLLGSLGLCFMVIGLVVFGMVYDVHIEKRHNQRKVRQTEQHATGKLAKAQMELWGQYHDEVKESHEADLLMKQLESQFSKFKPQFEGAVAEIAQELTLDKEKSGAFGKKILDLASEMQKENIKHSKHLLKHMITSGKHAAKLENNVSKQLQSEMQAEKAKEEEDEYYSDYDDAEKEDDDLKELLEEFFVVRHLYDGEFGEQFREELKKKGTVYNRLKTMYDGYSDPEVGTTTEDLSEMLSNWDLTPFGVNFTRSQEVANLSPDGIIETLMSIPNIPYDKIDELETKWRNNKSSSLSVFTELTDMRQKELIPPSWFEGSAYDEEDDEKDEAPDDDENE